MSFSFLSPQDLRNRLSEGKTVILLDTLMEDRFQAVHLPGALNACVYEMVFLDNVSRLIPEKDREIVVYGSSNKSLDAVTAAEKLVGAGYRDVSVLNGGIRDWKVAGYELEGEDVGALERMDSAYSLEDASYIVDCEQSVIHWFGRNGNSTHHGTVQLSSGEIDIKGARLAGGFEIDMSSIKNIDLEDDPLQPYLIAHLMSEDFFLVRLFPKASFTIKSVERVEEIPSSLPNLRVQGVFKLRGRENDIEFLAAASPPRDGEIKIDTHFDFDRTRWGVLYGSSAFFEHLGYHLVYNHISLEIRIVARERIIT
jgi:rhodanese-related sulfurtransferase/polyisoprenoid-binding protein YceI